MRSRVVKGALVLVVNLAVLAALLEFAGLAYFGLHDGRWYYVTRHKVVSARAAALSGGQTPPRQAEAGGEKKGDGVLVKYRLSPYYGFQYLPDTRVPVGDFGVPRADVAGNCKYQVNILCDNGEVFFVTNNYGFNSVFDYPYQKRSNDEFVIGIFGGSVALSFVKSTMPGLFDDVFSKAAQLRGKKVVVLSFAQAGVKQPQQLEMLAYFLSIGQRFDLVVNIDGGNEILAAMANHNETVDYSMPFATLTKGIEDIFGPPLRDVSREKLLGVYFWRSVEEKLLRRMAAMPLAGPGMVLDLGFRLAGRFEYDAQREAAAPAGNSTLDSPLYLLPQRPGTTLQQAIERSIEEWKRSSLLMAHMLHGLGIPYLHVLHPNQYFSKKVFTDEEKRVAISWGNGLAAEVHDYYPRMIEEGGKLVAAGVNFASAADIFDNVKETIYTDECCHFNAVGSLLLGRFIAGHIPTKP